MFLTAIIYWPLLIFHHYSIQYVRVDFWKYVAHVIWTQSWFMLMLFLKKLFFGYLFHLLWLTCVDQKLVFWVPRFLKKSWDSKNAFFLVYFIGSEFDNEVFSFHTTKCFFEIFHTWLSRVDGFLLHAGSFRQPDHQNHHPKEKAAAETEKGMVHERANATHSLLEFVLFSVFAFSFLYFEFMIHTFAFSPPFARLDVSMFMLTSLASSFAQPIDCQVLHQARGGFLWEEGKRKALEEP